MEFGCTHWNVSKCVNYSSLLFRFVLIRWGGIALWSIRVCKKIEFKLFNYWMPRYDGNLLHRSSFKFNDHELWFSRNCSYHFDDVVLTEQQLKQCFMQWHHKQLVEIFKTYSEIKTGKKFFVLRLISCDQHKLIQVV